MITFDDCSPFNNYSAMLLGGLETGHSKPMNYDIPDSLHPPGALYYLRVLVYQGSDFGSDGKANSGRGTRYSLAINVGPHEIRTPFQVYHKLVKSYCSIRICSDKGKRRIKINLLFCYFYCFCPLLDLLLLSSYITGNFIKFNITLFE